jgi:hypothetical protein
VPQFCRLLYFISVFPQPEHGLPACRLWFRKASRVSAEKLVSDLDLALLRQTIALSQASKERGRHPFAALVADRDGKVIVEAGNHSRPPQGDPTRPTPQNRQVMLPVRA